MARILGYRQDNDGESLRLYGGRGGFYAEYKGVHVQVEGSYEMVDDGTYNQNVVDVPYIVLDGDVYPIRTFIEIGNRE